MQPSLQAACCQIGNLVDGIKESNRNNFTHRHVCFDYKQIGWTTLEEGWVRVNVDGSVRMGGCQVSCGRVFRNEDGLWMEGFVSNLEVCNVLMAELNAILMWLGRGMCQSCGLKQIQP